MSARLEGAQQLGIPSDVKGYHRYSQVETALNRGRNHRPLSLDEIKANVSHPDFKYFAKDAYKSKDGYSIRFNPETGQKEMFIAGTRHASQWALNVIDGVLYTADSAASATVNDVVGGFLSEIGIPEKLHPHVESHLFSKLDRPRVKKEKFFADIAEKEGVDVVYGHSRGGAMAADLDVDTQKIGLDAAMMIAHDKHALNLYEGYEGMEIPNPMGIFDEVIGATGENNVHFDASYFSPHKVWKT